MEDKLKQPKPRYFKALGSLSLNRVMLSGVYTVFLFDHWVLHYQPHMAGCIANVCVIQFMQYSSVQQ